MAILAILAAAAAGSRGRTREGESSARHSAALKPATYIFPPSFPALSSRASIPSPPNPVRDQRRCVAAGVRRPGTPPRSASSPFPVPGSGCSWRRSCCSSTEPRLPNPEHHSCSSDTPSPPSSRGLHTVSQATLHHPPETESEPDQMNVLRNLSMHSREA
jgi:hypothetical protein